LTAVTKTLSKGPTSVANVNMRNLNSNIEYSIQSKSKDSKAIVMHNVENPNILDLSCDTLKFEKQNVDDNGNMMFNFKPDGQDHLVDIVNNGKVMATFGLKPKKIPNDNMTYSMKSNERTGERYVLVQNVDNTHNVQMKSDSIDFTKEETDGNNVRFYFTPDGNAHTLSLYDKDRLISSFGIRPNKAEVIMLEPVGDKHSFEVKNLYDQRIDLKTDRNIDWSHVKKSGKDFIEFTAPNQSQMIHVYTVKENEAGVLAKNGNIVLAPIKMFKSVPPMNVRSVPAMNVRSVQSNERQIPSQEDSQVYYTPIKSLYGEQGPPSSEMGQNVKAGNLVFSGNSKAF